LRLKSSDLDDPSLDRESRGSLGTAVVPAGARLEAMAAS
jgi:hypothetical protein